MRVRVFTDESGGWLVNRMRRVARGRGCTRDPRDSPHSLVRDTAETRGTAAGAGRAVRLAWNKADGDGRTGRRPLPGAMRPKRCHDRLCQRARRSGACKLQILHAGHEQPMTRAFAPARGLFTDRSILDLSLDFRWRITPASARTNPQV